mgnify:FL=1
MRENTSLYLPRVDATLSKHEIYETIENIGLGRIHDIILKSNKTRPYDVKTNSVFVKFIYWFDNEYVNVIRTRLFENNESLYVIYADPWFWKIMAYRRKPVYDMKRISFYTDCSANNKPKSSDHIIECV